MCVSTLIGNATCLVLNIFNFCFIGRASGFLLSTRLCSSHVYTFETLKVQNPKEWVYHVELHRPDKSNAINDTMWRLNI